VYRKLSIDNGRLVRLAGRGLSDQAIARLFGCCRATVLNHRAALGVSSTYGRHIARRAQEAELDRLWGRLSLDEKITLLTNNGETSTTKRQRHEKNKPVIPAEAGNDGFPPSPARSRQEEPGRARE
jgi:hypothetical protein